jgi:hypothetical protein
MRAELEPHKHVAPVEPPDEPAPPAGEWAGDQ